MVQDGGELHGNGAPKLRKAERGARALERWRIGPLLRRMATWHGVLVLNYHRIGVPDASGFDAELWSADETALERQLTLVADHFHVVTPADLVERPRARGRRVLITFDDGYRDNYELALPVLRRTGVPATFFVVPGFVDSPRVPWWDEIAWIVSHSDSLVATTPDLTTEYKRLPAEAGEHFLDVLAERAGTGRCPPELGRELWMSWDQVRELRDSGMTIGGHSLTHPVLARLDRDGQAAEIEGCAARLREELDLPMRWFSYPVGLDDAYDAHTRELVRGAGVELAFAFAGGYEQGAIADPLAVRRAAVAGEMSAARFAATVTLPQLFSRW